MVQCGDDKKIIDYNELIAEKLTKLQKLSSNVHDSNSGEGEGDNEFKAGLFARAVAVTDEEIIEEPVITPEEILEDAREEASRILEEARIEADLLRQQAYQESSKHGYDDGYQKALADINIEKAKL